MSRPSAGLVDRRPLRLHLVEELLGGGEAGRRLLQLVQPVVQQLANGVDADIEQASEELVAVRERLRAHVL